MIVDDAGFPKTIGERVLIQGKGSIKADDPAVSAAVKDVVSRLGRIDGVTDIESPLNASHRAETVSKDGRSVVVNFTLPGSAESTDDQAQLEKSAEAPLAAVAAVQDSHPQLRVEEYGDASAQKALGATERADEAKSDAVLDGRHAADPADRVRRGRRRRRPAAARHLRPSWPPRACSARSASSARSMRPSDRSRC